MKRSRPALLALLLLLLGSPVVLAAQAAPPGFRDEILRQFDTSTRKLVALAEAMPADRYTWSPGEGVMQVGHVYGHIANYNYGYPAVMGVPVPAGVDAEGLEALRDKAQLVQALRASAEHVRGALAATSDEELAAPTRLYGRDVPKWSVLLQLVAHMNEHLGQSIAYARMNEVTPPWSR